MTPPEGTPDDRLRQAECRDDARRRAEKFRRFLGLVGRLVSEELEIRQMRLTAP